MNKIDLSKKETDRMTVSTNETAIRIDHICPPQEGKGQIESQDNHLAMIHESSISFHWFFWPAWVTTFLLYFWVSESPLSYLVENHDKAEGWWKNIYLIPVIVASWFVLGGIYQKIWNKIAVSLFKPIYINKLKQ